jgi:transposase
MDLKDEQWNLVAPLFPQPIKRADGKGRPRVDDRAILNGILWILRTGARWQDLPERYPPYQTCHRRFQEWVRSGAFEQVLRTLITDVKERGGLDLTECFIDGTFVIAKKGGAGWEKPSGARVASSWQWQMALVCLSPYPLKVLRRMKSDWLRARSPTGSSKKRLSG